MPLATPPVFDGWVNTHSSRRDRPAARTLEPESPEPAGNHQTPTLVGQSPVMRKLFSVIERVAPTDASVLITGATGTGKELAARAIHNMSPRCDEAFVDINCSAIPETLIEAELFGHQRGTFTGAHENRSGLFEKASGGTLFLDEVDALNLSAQAKLLRVLQERTVRRIGARANIAIDVRIVSATNCNLAEAVAAGRFRPDLYYRLRVLPLHLPELCTRAGDITLLVDHFLRMKAERQGRTSVPRFTPEAMHTLNEYPWPGNVRELENVIEYALALGLEDELGVMDLPPEIVSEHRQQSADSFRQLLQAYMNDTVPLAEVEKRYILSVLQQFGGNQVRAAAALGIDRSKLYRRLKQYGVMAVRFLQEEDLNGLQLLSGNEVIEVNSTRH
ncbi:MAG TPA: sigma-54 dependent transcriptional regulator [Pyrinomonadaceae bacterium]|nr:sigma-54 dependent transcriptional regulator [Pyrinomonadaceae bacterium]